MSKAVTEAKTAINLRELRTGKGLTQEQVAAKIGISRSYYTILENRMPWRVPAVNIVRKLAKVFGFDWKDYYEEACELDWDMDE